MTTSSHAEIFKFEASTKVRTFLLNGAPWFVAQDVCSALKIKNATQAVERLDNDERSMFNIGLDNRHLFDSRVQEVNIISWSGLFTIILRCRDAVTPGTIPYRFRRWVTNEVLPALIQTGYYAMPGSKPETLGDLAGTGNKLASTMSIRDGRRGKSATASKAAQRIADECVPMIMKAVQNQYHYSNENVGPAEFLPAVLSDKGKTQLHALLRELAENGHDVSGAHRELEIVRYMLAQQQKLLLDIATHAAYIQQATKIQ